MDLDKLMNQTLPKNPPLFAEVRRELTAEDIELSNMLRGKGDTQAPQIKQLREGHHRVARLLATGLKAVEVSAITGYTQCRISILKKDPAFSELLEFYREREDARTIDIQEMLGDLSATGLTILRERLEEDPDSISHKTLLDIAQLSLDRTGHGPVTKSANISVMLSQEDLDAIKSSNERTSQIHAKQDWIENNPELAMGYADDKGSSVCWEEETLREPIEGEVIRKELGE